MVAHGAESIFSSSSRLQLADLAERVLSGRLKPIIEAVRPLAEAPSAFTPVTGYPARRPSRHRQPITERWHLTGQRYRSLADSYRACRRPD
jgi:hypothetical protein